MGQNSDLFINVINNISVTTTIIYSVLIITVSIEISLILNKGLIFLVSKHFIEMTLDHSRRLLLRVCFYEICL